ncbi:MAG: hypothetical protein LUQ38_02555 [Methanotrichaceae archaeon]|nr:hypothetical protein [Methanotrichaceae archaeon]
MSEESEYLSLLLSANMDEIEHYKDSDYAFAFIELDVISRGWHQGKVAMRGKGSSKRLREAEQSLGSSAWIGSVPLRRDGTKCRKKDGREYSSDIKGSIPINIAQPYFVGKGQQKETVLGLKEPV